MDSDLEINESGAVTVSDELKDTYRDPTLPLEQRLDKLSRTKEMDEISGAYALLTEASDFIASSRTAAGRRGRAQETVQANLHWAAQEIMFLRAFIKEKGLDSPNYVRVI